VISDSRENRSTRKLNRIDVLFNRTKGKRRIKKNSDQVREGFKHSDDQTDARYLAHLLRLGILPTGTILPPKQHAMRDLTRKRMQLVRSRTTHILAIENITTRQ